MMNCQWCVVVLLLYIGPLVDAGQSNTAKLQQAKQQLHARAAKQQQQQQQQQQGIAAGQRQQNVKLSGIKPVVLAKTSTGQKPVGTKKQKAGLQQKPVQSVPLKQQPKQAQLKQSLKAQKIKPSATAKIPVKKQAANAAKQAAAKQTKKNIKIEKRPQIYIQPIKSKQELEQATLALRCGKNRNYYCINETTCCTTAQGEWACCPKPGVSDPSQASNCTFPFTNFC